MIYEVWIERKGGFEDDLCIMLIALPLHESYDELACELNYVVE